MVAERGPAERSSAEASIVINTNQITSLPVNGRDWSGLTLLAPFAQDDGGGNQRAIRFAGRAIDDNNFNFDGVDAGGIQEQSAKIASPTANFRGCCGGVPRQQCALQCGVWHTSRRKINVVTKSGTNDFHGTGFGYLRNSVFDARNFTDFDLNGNPAIPPFRLGQYGLTVGGPIWKNKTFFFLSYEGLRQLQSTSQVATVPSALLQADILVNGRNGNGPSPEMGPILQAFPWRASTGTFGTCAAKMAFPDGAFVALDSDTDQFTHATPTVIHEDTWLIRIDHKFSDKTTLYGRAQRDIVHSDQPISPLFDQQHIVNHPANYFLALQHIFAANLFNEAKIFINRSPYHNPQASVLPYAVNTDNFTGINNNTEDVEIGTTFGFIDNLTWTHGRHTFKTGMEIRRIRLNQGQTADNALTFGDNDSLVAASVTKLNFIAPWCCHKLRRTMYMPYFQDEWKVTPTFTVNLGIRWDYYGVANEPDHRTTVFDVNQFHGACLGSGSLNTPFPVPINTPPCPTNPTLYEPNYRNFDPRVSFAWAPSSLHGKTVIRAGFGIYSGAAQNDDLNAGLESDTFRVSVVAPPLTPAIQQEIPDLSAFTGTDSFSKAANHPRALQRVGRKDQYVETWGLTVEHQLPAGLLFSTSYLGTHGVRLFSRGAVNLCNIPVVINPNNQDCYRPLDQFFPDPAHANDPTFTIDPYGSVDFKSDTGQSTYHALFLSLERRLTNGLSFQAHYTFSHSINDGAVGGGEANGQENVNCRQCDKGPSVFDVRHNVTVNAVYDLPFGPGKTYLHDSGPVGKIVGGWELSSIGTWHTGHPLTVKMGLGGSIVAPGTLFDGLAQTYLLPDGNDQTDQRPDLVPGVPIFLPGGGKNGTPLINPAAFQAPPTDSNGNFTRFGNAPNGIARALDIWQVDLALMKDTKLTERFSIEFGVQAFNVFNHTQLGDPGNLTLDYNQPLPGSSTPNNLSIPGDFALITNSVNGLARTPAPDCHDNYSSCCGSSFKDAE